MLALENDPRNAALLRLIYAAGLRISEACALRWRDLTERDDAGQVTVFGKGGNTARCGFRRPVWWRVTALRVDAGPDSSLEAALTLGSAYGRPQRHPPD